MPSRKTVLQAQSHPFEVYNPCELNTATHIFTMHSDMGNAFRDIVHFQSRDLRQACLARKVVRFLYTERGFA